MRCLIFLLILLPLAAFAQIPERQLPSKTIAIISDQPSPYFEKIIKGFLGNLEPLARDQYELKTIPLQPESTDLADIKMTLQNALEDPKIDAIFTAGIATSHAALKIPAEQRTKPVIAGAMEFSDLNNSLITPDGGSKLPNYSFVLVPKRLRSDLGKLSSLANTRIIDVLIEESVIKNLGAELTKNVDAFEAANNLDLQIIPVPAGNLSLANLSKNTRAVYVPLLPSLTQEERKAVFKTLARKKKISSP